MAGPTFMRSPIFGTPQAQPGMIFAPNIDMEARKRKQRIQTVGDTLTQLGIGLLGQGTSTTPQSPLQGLAAGLQGANQMAAQRSSEAQDQQRMDLAQGQFDMQQQEFKAKQALEEEQRRQRDEIAKTLPPEYQAYVNEPEFWKAYFDTKFAKPEGPQSPIAKAQADLKAGRMSQAEYDAFVRKETYIRPPDSVTVNQPPVEGAFAKAFGGAEGDAAGKLANEVGSSAQSQLEQLDALKQAVSDLQAAGGDTNAAAPLKLKATQIAQALGFDPKSFGLPDSAGPAELINSISNRLAMQARNPASGAGMPGAMSDSDREFLKQTVPSLGDSPQGMAAKVEVASRVAQRQAEMAYLWNSGKYDQTQEGFRRFKKDWANYIKAHPLFSVQDRQQWNRSAVIGAPQTTAPAPGGTTYTYDSSGNPQ